MLHLMLHFQTKFLEVYVLDRSEEFITIINGTEVINNFPVLCHLHALGVPRKVNF